MHELAIIQDLLNVCEENAHKNNANKILKIELKIGRLSGVEAHYLHRAFEGFKSEKMFENAELIIHTQDVVIKCESCGFEGGIKKNRFVCIVCGGTRLKVIDGEELLLLRLEME